jgi:transposase
MSVTRGSTGTRRSPTTFRARTAATPSGRQPSCCAKPRRSARPPSHWVERILATKPHPEQGFRACLRILRLVRSYGPERLEAACQRGVDIGARSYGSVQSILQNGLDRAFCPEPVPDELPVQHENIRGSGYYH